MRFEIIPDNPKQELAFYEARLKDFEITTKDLIHKRMEIPPLMISLAINYSKNIRALKKRLKE